MNQKDSINFHYDNYENEHIERPRFMGVPDLRRKFVKTVYSILLVQLLVTSIFVFLNVFFKPFAWFQ